MLWTFSTLINVRELKKQVHKMQVKTVSTGLIPLLLLLLLLRVMLRLLVMLSAWSSSVLTAASVVAVDLQRYTT